MNAADLTHVDIRQVAALAAQHGERILAAWLPDGKRQGGEWIARNPTRNDHKAGSLSVNVATGRGGDFATGDTWGDFVGMVAALDGLNQGEAARKLADFLGGGSLPSPVRRGNGAGHASRYRPRRKTSHKPRQARCTLFQTMFHLCRRIHATGGRPPSGLTAMPKAGRCSTSAASTARAVRTSCP